MGIFDTIFGKVLLYVTALRVGHALWLIPFLPIVGFGIVFMYDKFGKNSINGMILVFEAGHGEADEIPTRLMPLVTISTWLTHLLVEVRGEKALPFRLVPLLPMGLDAGSASSTMNIALKYCWLLAWPQVLQGFSKHL